MMQCRRTCPMRKRGNQQPESLCRIYSFAPPLLFAQDTESLCRIYSFAPPLLFAQDTAQCKEDLEERDPARHPARRALMFRRHSGAAASTVASSPAPTATGRPPKTDSSARRMSAGAPAPARSCRSSGHTSAAGQASLGIGYGASGDRICAAASAATARDSCDGRRRVSRAPSSCPVLGFPAGFEPSSRSGRPPWPCCRLAVPFGAPWLGLSRSFAGTPGTAAPCPVASGCAHRARCAVMAADEASAACSAAAANAAEQREAKLGDLQGSGNYRIMGSGSSCMTMHDRQLRLCCKSNYIRQ